MRFAQIVVQAPLPPLDYAIVEELRPALRPGVAVRVPLGPRTVSGYVLSLTDTASVAQEQLKPILGLDPENPSLPDEVMALLLFAASYYATPIGDILRAALPATARRTGSRYAITPQGKHALDLAAQHPTESGATSDLGPPAGQALGPADVTLLTLASRFPRSFTVAAVEKDLRLTRRTANARLQRLAREGFLRRQARREQPLRLTAYTRTEGASADSVPTRKKAVRAVLDAIPTEGTITAAELSKRHPGAYAACKTLEKMGLVEKRVHECLQRPTLQFQVSAAIPIPSPAQQAAVDAIGHAVQQRVFKTFLLQGVTGSGKTEVYLRLIDLALQQGRTALILVPEIALTPQLSAHFCSRFGDRVATFHSGLSGAQKRDEWDRVAQGRAQIALGARSAIFLPLGNIGVIVVDEEHESAFKQAETPRYNARDLAVFRGRQHGAAVVLGSATPSLETRHNADVHRYEHLVLRHRVAGRPLPRVDIVSLGEAPRVGTGIFTQALAEAIERTLGRGEQVVIFLNRRGFAPFVHCRDCGFSCRCSDCDVSLTLHRQRDLLICHYCGFVQPSPERCPSCAGHRFEGFGLGTEKVELELRTLLGDVPVARLDRDTVRKRGDADALLNRFRRREIEVLVGTQMVTKGHDFPNVTLVGVVSADASLNFPDFRAAERTFQLLTQVSGRAGRGDTPGHVLIQAFETDHYAITAASNHDYEGFWAQEMPARRELSYPPFAHLALLRCQSEDEQLGKKHAQDLAAAMRDVAQQQSLGTTVLGPAPAPIGRIKKLYRVHILVKAQRRDDLRALLRGLHVRPPPGVSQILDVDPLNML